MAYIKRNEQITPELSTDTHPLLDKQIPPSKKTKKFKGLVDNIESSKKEDRLPNLDMLVNELIKRKKVLKNPQSRQLFQLINTETSIAVSNTLISISRKLFKTIPEKELFNTKDTECQNKMRLINYQNGLAGYIISNILQDTKNPASATVKKEFWIWVMDAALKQHDFVTTMSIFTALKSVSIYRLMNVDLGISETAKNIIEDCEMLFSGSGLFENLRNKQEQIDGAVLQLNPYGKKLDGIKDGLRTGLQASIRSKAIDDKTILKKLIDNLTEKEISEQAKKLLIELHNGIKTKEELSDEEQLLIGNVVLALIEKDKKLYTTLENTILEEHPELKNLQSNPQSQAIVGMIRKKQEKIALSSTELSPLENQFYNLLPHNYFDNRSKKDADYKLSQELFPRKADPEKYKSDILLRIDSQEPFLKPLEIAPIEKAPEISSQEMLDAIKIAFHEELGDELPEAFTLIANNLQSAHNINAAFKCIGPAPRIAESENETTVALLDRIKNLFINGEQRQLIRRAFSAEIELVPNNRENFEIALTSHPFSYDGINAILKTLSANFKLPLKLQNGSQDELNVALTQYANNTKIRQLILESFKDKIETASTDNKNKFYSALYEIPLTEVSAVNNVLETLDRSLQLPSGTTDENLELTLKNAAEINHFKKLIFDTVKSEITPEKQEEFKDALREITQFTQESVNQLLQSKLEITLPAEEDLEKSLEQLNQKLANKRRFHHALNEMSDYFERISSTLNTTINFLNDSIKPKLESDTDKQLLTTLLAPFIELNNNLEHEQAKITMPDQLIQNDESLQYVQNIITALSTIAPNEAVRCAISSYALKGFVTEKINTTKILNQLNEEDRKNLLQLVNESYAIAFQAFAKYDLFTRDLIKFANIEPDETTKKYPEPYDAIRNNAFNMVKAYNEAVRIKEREYLHSFNNAPLIQFISSLNEAQYSKAKLYLPDMLAQFNKILAAEEYSKNIDAQLKTLFGFTLETIPGKEIFTQSQFYQNKLYQQLAISKPQLAAQLEQLGVVLTNEKVLALTVGNVKEVTTPQMNATQARLIEYAFETEVENNKNRDSEFRQTLLENPFTYEGINAVLKTLTPKEKPYFAPQLSRIYEEADTEILTTVLEGLRKTKDQRQLIHEAFKPDLLKANEDKVKNFEQQLTTSIFDTKNEIETIIKPIIPNFKLPDTITDNNLNDFLKNLPVLNSQKKLLRKKIKNELTIKNKAAVENAMDQMNDFTFDSVNNILALLDVTPPLRLPEHDNVEVAIQRLPTGLTEIQKASLIAKFEKEITEENSAKFYETLEKIDFTPDGINELFSSLLGNRETKPFQTIDCKFLPSDRFAILDRLGYIKFPGISRTNRELISKAINLVFLNAPEEEKNAFYLALESSHATFTKKDVNKILAALDKTLKLPTGGSIESALSNLRIKIEDKYVQTTTPIEDITTTEESPKKKGIIARIKDSFKAIKNRFLKPHTKPSYQPLEETKPSKPIFKEPSLLKRALDAISRILPFKKGISMTHGKLSKKYFTPVKKTQTEETEPLLAPFKIEEKTSEEEIPNLLYIPPEKQAAAKPTSKTSVTKRIVSKEEKQNFIQGILDSRDLIEKLAVNFIKENEYIELTKPEHIKALANSEENYTYRMSIANKDKQHEIIYDMNENEYTINESDPDILQKLCQIAKNCQHNTFNLDQLPQDVKARAWVIFKHEGLNVEGDYKPSETQKEKYEHEFNEYLKMNRNKSADNAPKLTPYGDIK